MEYRMYGFVPYQLTGIQKGIQFLHAVAEYSMEYSDSAYKHWAKNDKTVILLNGGTTRDNQDDLGSLNQIAKDLKEAGISFALFREPDLNYSLTAVCFLADERIWDWENHPAWREYVFRELGENVSKERKEELDALDDEALEYEFPQLYNLWINDIGGTKNAFLKDLIRGKSLA